MKRSNRFGLRRSSGRILRIGARPGGEEGAALSELTVVTPFLSMLLLGIIWGGITFCDYVVLADAVAAGARTLAANREAGASSSTNQNACQLAQGAIQSATQKLNQSNLTIPTPALTGPGGSTCDSLIVNDTGIMWAAYACNLPIPFTSMNLCPLAQGGAINANLTTGTLQVGTCPYTHCISAVTTVLIE
jgi:hypothetical protein